MDSQGQGVAPGRLLAGRYRLGERLGRGGMASVFRATDELLGRDVAVKVLDLHRTDDTGPERFRREARATASLSHPNIVTVFDTGVEGDDAFLVMELLPGPTLADQLRDHGPLPIAEVIRIGSQVAAALAAAHEARIVHRDIKPANISRTADGAVKVLDFGITRLLDDAADSANSPLTIPDTVIGTAQYLSPEQGAGRAVDHRADLYALGCVLFAMLTGRAPFRGDNAVATVMLHQTAPVPDVRAQRPDTPDALAAVVADLLAKEPAARPATAREVADRLRRASLHVATSGAPTMVFPTTPAAAPPTANPTAQPSGDAGAGTVAVPASAAGQPLPAAPAPAPPSRRTSGAVATVLALLLLAGLGVAALLWFRPGLQGVGTTASPTTSSTVATSAPAAEETTSVEPPATTPAAESTPETSPTVTPPQETTTEPAASSPADPPADPSADAGQIVGEHAAGLADAAAAAEAEGSITKDDRKAVDAGIRSLQQAVRQGDDQQASDALSAIDQALSESGAKDEFTFLYDELKLAVDDWTSTLG